MRAHRVAEVSPHVFQERDTAHFGMRLLHAEAAAERRERESFCVITAHAPGAMIGDRPLEVIADLVLEIAVDPPRLKEGRDSRDEHPEGHPRHARRGDSSRIRATMPDVRVQRSVSA